MTSSRYRLAVIIGSVRHGRFGVSVARWFVSHAAQRDNIDIDLVDLADHQHPVDMTDHPDTGRFAGHIADADAIVIVTPEYNHSYPGPLKTAIDSVRAEWRGKPVAFVSYGGLSGGLRSVEALRVVFAELHATTIRETVSFHNAWDQFDHAGHAQPGPADKAAAALLDQLGWWALALHDARTATPYPA
ncbi:MAG TPA: NAD(P)H-dependent oxidoreductase [Mycobacteriales bacterium]